MTAAKEQARIRVQEQFPDALKTAGEAAADIASGVWEPLVREAYEALDRSVPKHDTYEGLIEAAQNHQAALNKLKEALGE